jgi:hypothetical protein
MDQVWLAHDTMTRRAQRDGDEDGVDQSHDRVWTKPRREHVSTSEGLHIDYTTEDGFAVLASKP